MMYRDEKYAIGTTSEDLSWPLDKGYGYLPYNKGGD